ncbi:MAG: hypothetical protein U0325_30925 [Polyangiales bacterium]
MIENAARIGAEVLGPGLRAIAERHPSVGEVRGVGVVLVRRARQGQAQREMLVPYNASGPANAPMVEPARRCDVSAPCPS